MQIKAKKNKIKQKPSDLIDVLHFSLRSVFTNTTK
jgi:hypothetical protein